MAATEPGDVIAGYRLLDRSKVKIGGYESTAAELRWQISKITEKYPGLQSLGNSTVMDRTAGQIEMAAPAEKPDTGALSQNANQAVLGSTHNKPGLRAIGSSGSDYRYLEAPV